MNKRAEIEAYLQMPIQIGDSVYVSYEKKENVAENLVLVKEIKDECIFYKKYGYHELQSAPIHMVRKSTSHIGADNFKPRASIYMASISIDGLMSRVGFVSRSNIFKHDPYFKVPIPKCNFDSTIVGENGEDICYQRPLCWGIEEKQALIDSIYNNVDIGKFILRERSFDWIEERIEQGKIANTAAADIVDGKQRITTLIDFLSGKFPDSYGSYWNDLSGAAQCKFLNYTSLSYGEMDEKSSDKDVLNTFLAINFAGVPMSKEHIDFVKGLDL